MPDHIKRIEAEYGMPILEVIEGYARDKESRQSTAGILEIPSSTFHRWLGTHASNIEWCRVSEGNSWREAIPLRDTEKRKESAIKNLAKAREVAPRTPTVATAEVMEKVKEAKKRGISWRGMPSYLGMQCDWTTLRRGFKKDEKKSAQYTR